MKQAFGRILAGVAAVLCMASVACAAGINANEQRVLNEVSKPFSYNGKTYLVKSQNIAEGRARLSDEDIDLTAAEANECISRFHQSYEELVSEGYCEEQAGSEQTEPDAQASPERKHSKQEAAVNKEYLKQMLGSPGKEKAEKKPSVDEETKASDSLAQTSPAPTADVWLEKDTTEEVMEFDSQDVSNAVERQLTITYAEKEFTISGKEEKEEIDRYTKQGLRIWKTAFLILSIFTGIVMVSLLGYIGMMHRHRRRKRGVKKVFAVLTGICVTSWFSFLLIACGLYFGVYSKSGIHRQLMESDYFTGVAQMLQTQTAERLMHKEYDSAIAEEVFHLSNIYIEEKQYIDDVLSGGKDASVSVEKIHLLLEEKLKQEDSAADAGLVTAIETDYKNILHFELGKRIRISKEAWLPWFYLTVAAGVSVSAFLAVFVWIMYGHWYKVAQIHGSGLLAASLAVTVAAVAAGISRIEEKFMVKPAFYFEFIKKYVRWDIQVFFYVGCTGLLLAAGMLAIKLHYSKLYH